MKQKSEKEPDTLIEKYRDEFHDWTQRSTSHGLPNIFRAKNICIGVMWSFFFLASLGYCSYVVVKSIIEYAKYDTIVSIKRIQDLPVDFPAVTICNVITFNEYYAQEYIKTKAKELLCLETSADADQLAACDNSDVDSSNADIIDRLLDKLKRLIANDDTVVDITNYGFYLNQDMLVSCSFNNAPCDEENFTLEWSNEYGNCYTFNDGKTQSIFKTGDSGSGGGLIMELVVQNPLNETKYSYSTGLYVFIHNQSTVPFSVETPITIPSGSDAYVGISRTFIKKKSKPYSDCIDSLKPFSNYSTKLFNYFKDLNVDQYSQDFCYTLCYQDQLYNKCNCADLVTPIYNGAAYCVTTAELDCLDEFSNNFKLSDIKSTCNDACPPECNSINYEARVDLATFPTIGYLKYLWKKDDLKDKFPENESLLAEFARQGFLKVTINYESLYYTLIEESPATTFEQLLGNVGGQLGLFIGISLLSFIELLELVSEIIHITFMHRKEKTNSKAQQRLPRYLPRFMSYPNRY